MSYCQNKNSKLSDKTPRMLGLFENYADLAENKRKISVLA